jgi:hypothetical protein
MRSWATGSGKTSGYTLDVRNNLRAFGATPWTSWAAEVGINDSGTIVGNYFDASGVEHGFIATPQTAP